MTRLYFTIDTEYSYSLAARGVGRAENYACSIAGTTPTGDYGIGYQMDRFDAAGLKAVFFVDPMPALIWGVEALADVVQPIIKRGHDVQLHIHTEWLSLTGAANPLGEGRNGQSIKHFTLDEQRILLGRARELLVEAGAPPPVAFRAGNYGANDDTLRALAELGIAYDTSHTPGISGGECDISLGRNDRDVRPHAGVTEVPVASIAASGGGQRHFQLTALSCNEMLAALRHAVRSGQESVTLVSHSFELLSRDRRQANRIVVRRFDRLCEALARLEGVQTATYAHAPPRASQVPITQLPHSRWRTGHRQIEQAIGNLLYGRG